MGLFSRLRSFTPSIFVLYDYLLWLLFFFFLLSRRVCVDIVAAFIEDYGALVLVKTELVVDRSYVGRRDIVPVDRAAFAFTLPLL